jgi:hypothetical protein
MMMMMMMMMMRRRRRRRKRKRRRLLMSEWNPHCHSQATSHTSMAIKEWFQAHEHCPACAVFRDTPCAGEFARYNAARELKRPAAELGEQLDACVARHGWIVEASRAEPLIEKALKAPRAANPPRGTSERLLG